MSWFWLILLLAAVTGLTVVVAVRKKRRRRDKVEKYVCSVCHGTDCDCRRVE